MYFKQFYLGCLSHASYMMGDEKTKTAVVVDPQRDIEQYIEEAKKGGFQIKHVFLTHFHADFVAGHLELEEKTGAKIHMGRRAKPEYEIAPVKEGDRFEFGDVALEILETPGHTPEMISLVVYDLAKDRERPYAVLTGDTLFIGDVGRPDLLASEGVTAQELGKMLYHSLREKLMKLPDETLVYPAHGAGSLCGKNLSDQTVSTIGEQKRHNYALQRMSESEFIEIVTADQPEAPAYFAHDVQANKEKRPVLEETLKRGLQPLDCDDVLKLREEGVQLLDVRDAIAFAGAYLSGSINIGLEGKFATWVGTLLKPDVPLVIIAEPGREREAAMRLGRIGFDNVRGYLKDGMRALHDRPDAVSQGSRITATELQVELRSSQPPLILDIRSANERKLSSIEGSRHIPLNELAARSSELPAGSRIVVQCAGGYRSAIGASILKKEGFRDIADLLGGIPAWEKLQEAAV